MAEVSLLVMLALFVIAAIVLFRVVRGVLQGVVLVSAVLAIILAVGAVVVVNDVIDLKAGIGSKGLILAVSSDDGLRIGSGVVARGNGTEVLAQTDVKILSAQFAVRDYGSMLGSRRLLIVVKESSLPGVLQGPPAQEAVRLVPLHIVKVAGYSGLAELAADYGSRLVADPFFMFGEYREGGITAYPETPSLKAVKVLPVQLIRALAGNFLKRASEVTGQAVRMAELP